jgi:nitrate/TMAO reductase-like tetraheme cytochrome c subunit
VDGKWQWAGISQAEWNRRQLPGATSQFLPKEQFHLVHLAGKTQGRSNCTDCHKSGFEGEAIRQGVRESCADCHGAPLPPASAAFSFPDTARNRMIVVSPNAALCVSCHSQHGQEKNLRASLRREFQQVAGVR